MNCPKAQAWLQLTLNYGNVTVDDGRIFLLDHSLVANDDRIVVPGGITPTIPCSMLLANDTDPDNDALSIGQISVTSLGGGHITRTPNGVVYTPPSQSVSQDAFAYLVNDGKGGVALGLVTVAFVHPLQLSIAFDQSQQATVQMGGTPGVTYRMEVSEDLVNWTPLATVTVNSYGGLEATAPDASNKPHRFYRAVAQ